jgi:hypothetical protein
MLRLNSAASLEAKADIDCLEVLMKVAIVFFLLASPALAQNKPTDPPVAPGCGTDDANFEVTKVKDQHPVTQPEAEKALVYFIEDDREYDPTRKPTMLAASTVAGWERLMAIPISIFPLLPENIIFAPVGRVRTRRGLLLTSLRRPESCTTSR